MSDHKGARSKPPAADDPRYLRTCTRCGRVRQWTCRTVRAAETRSSHFPTRTRAAQICGKGGIETERERLILEVARSNQRVVSCNKSSSIFW